MVFPRLYYPKTLVENTITHAHSIEMKVTENECSKQQVWSDEQDAPSELS